MTKNHILGLDIAQKSAFAQLDRADGTRCWRGTLPASQTGWQQLKAMLAEHGAQPDQTLVILEATGVHHFAWAERLLKDTMDVHVLNPLLASRLHSAANALRDHKTDAVDTARLCQAGRLHHEQLGRFRHLSRPAQQGLRQLDHARRQLRSTLTNLKKSLKSHLELVFPALLRADIEPWSARGQKILTQAPTAGAWRALSEVQRLELAGGKQLALDRACEETLADEALAQACAPAVNVLLNAQQDMARHLRECDQDILPRLPGERVALICSIPGFGERTASVMATYLPASFEDWGGRKQITARLQALFGCDPRLQQSGKWTGRIKLSKRGIAAARTALFQAAFCSMSTDEENAAYYKALRAVGKEHKQAMVDLMRKQLRRLVAVLCNNRPFEKRTHLPKPLTSPPRPLSA